MLDRIKGEIDGSELGLLYARADDFTKASELFSDAYDRRELFLIWMRYDAATPKTLLQDRRWLALWQRPLLREWQRYHDKIAAELQRATD